MKFVIIMLCSSLPCFAGPGFLAQQYKPSGVTLFAPTNISGYNMVAWWPVWGGYATNGNQVLLEDQWTNSYHLTNYDDLAASFPVGNQLKLNNYPTLSFVANNNSLLRSIEFTNKQPCEYYIVAALTNSVNEGYIFDARTNTFGRNALAITNNQLMMYAGTEFGRDILDGWTNIWTVWNMEMNGANSVLYSNNIPVATNNVGNQNADGMTLGAKYTINFPAEFEIAEFGAYSTNLSASARTALFNYLVDWYKIFGVPPSDISALAYRWKGSFYTNGTINWTDSVQNVTFTVTLGDAIHYTNVAGGGIWFDGLGNGFKKVDNIGLTNWSAWFTMKPDALNIANGWTYDGSLSSIIRNVTNAISVYINGENLTTDTLTAGTAHDVLITDDGTIKIYTNGVFFTNFVSKPNWFLFSGLGIDAVSSKFHGIIYEAAFWTNGILDTNDAMKLHNYAGHTYGY